MLREGCYATDPAIPLWGTGVRPDKNRSPRAVRGAGALATRASTGRRDRQQLPPFFAQFSPPRFGEGPGPVLPALAVRPGSEVEGVGLKTRTMRKPYLETPATFILLLYCKPQHRQSHIRCPRHCLQCPTKRKELHGRWPSRGYVEARIQAARIRWQCAAPPA